MLINEIIKDKGRAVITVKATDTLAAVAQLLDAKRIGAVVAIEDSGALCGVISERDIVRQLARHGAGALQKDVASAMTRGVITAEPSETLDRCLARMTDRRIRHLPVLKDGALVGIVSIGDLVRWKIDSVLAEAEAMTAYIHGN